MPWGGWAGASADDDDVNEPIQSFVNKGMHGHSSSQPGGYPSARPSQAGTYPSGVSRTWQQGSWVPSNRGKATWWQTVGANLCLLAVLAAALLASMGTGYFNPADWSRGVAAHRGLVRGGGGGGGDYGGGGARRGRGGSGWEDKYLEEKLSEVKSKEETEKRRLAEADSEVEKEHAEESEGEGKKEIEVRELQRKVGELERKVVSGHLQSTEEQERALASAGEEVKSLEGRLQKLEAEEQHRRASDQAEHRRVVALEAKDEALRGKVEKSVGDAKKLGHLKARMRELENNEKEREKAMASGEIEELKKTLGDKLNAEKARVQALTRQNEEARRQLEEAAKPLMSVGGSWKSEPQGGKKMSYEEEVEDKEQKLEKKIDKQAAKIERGDRGVDMEGLDKKHRVMLRNMEQRDAQRVSRASHEADADLKKRGKEIDDIMGSNSNCPGPDCMLDRPKEPRAVREAKSWAANRYSTSSR